MTNTEYPHDWPFDAVQLLCEQDAQLETRNKDIDRMQPVVDAGLEYQKVSMYPAPRAKAWEKLQQALINYERVQTRQELTCCGSTSGVHSVGCVADDANRIHRADSSQIYSQEQINADKLPSRDDEQTQQTGESVKVYLSGESPWVEVIEESDGRMKGRIINKLFHEYSEHEQARVMKRDWESVDSLPKLHDYKQGDEVWFKKGGFDEWVPVEQGQKP